MRDNGDLVDCRSVGVLKNWNDQQIQQQWPERRHKRRQGFLWGSLWRYSLLLWGIVKSFRG